ncbi:MAG TPA: zinc ribbon domain-containing protein [Solirubrobacteraceae bacterium]|nr:zinc ribbon domain-containing protein [Solirubrobacteraceae bacterium]
MPPIAYFGIESSGLSLAIDLLILFAVVMWLSLVYWTYADARRRIADPMLVGCATAASLFPFVGTLVYMILRPPEYLEDVRERELDLQAAEARLHELDSSLCPHCDYRVERDFVRCPSCLRKLKERCASCSRPLDRAWTICPYCEAEVASAAKPARRTRRESAAGRAAEPPTRARARGEEEIALDPLPVEPPARRRSGAAAVRAPEATSLLAPAEPPPAGSAEAADPLAGAENGRSELSEPAPRRRSRRSE